MLEHLQPEPRNPERVVLLGAKGFVAGATRRHLGAAGIPALALGADNLDLRGKHAAALLREQLQEGDALVFVSALAPCKTPEGLVQNLEMAESVCDAIEDLSLSQVVYVSSDAVYRDSENPVSETSCADGPSLHGVMHRAREVMLQACARAPLAILRPSLLYGADDPHNGYGPNRFRRQAARGETIRLFGEGEEQRDHVWIEDVAEILVRVLTHRSQGVLNIATGRSLSFRQVAEAVVRLEPQPVPIEGTPRQNPIVHRHFDITAALKAFPDFRYTPLEQGLEA